MKKIDYYCDRGSAAIRTSSGDLLLIPNGFGDCSSTIYIAESWEEFNQYEKDHRQYYNYDCGDFIDHCATFEFKEPAEVLYYDCPHKPNQYGSGVFLEGLWMAYSWSCKVYLAPLSDGKIISKVED